MHNSFSYVLVLCLPCLPHRCALCLTLRVSLKNFPSLPPHTTTTTTTTTKICQRVKEGGRTTMMMMITIITRSSATAEEPRDALRQLKYYCRFF